MFDHQTIRDFSLFWNVRGRADNTTSVSLHTKHVLYHSARTVIKLAVVRGAAAWADARQQTYMTVFGEAICAVEAQNHGEHGKKTCVHTPEL